MTSHAQSGLLTNQEGVRRKIDSLTSLRGIAALWVLIHNDAYFREALNTDAQTALLAKGYLGVDFFLVLSGFVITHVHSAEMKEFSWRRYRDFLWLRLGRIYPLYALLLLIRCGIEVVKLKFVGDAQGFAGPPPFQETNSPTALVANVLMVQAWGGYTEHTWVPSFWSVSAEWFAYLVFPFLLVTLYDILQKVWGAALVSAVCLLGLGVGNRLNGGLEFPVNYSLARCLPEFIIGMSIASAFVARVPRILSYNSASVVCALMIGVAYLVHIGADDMLVLGLLGLIVAVLASDTRSERAALSRLLEHRSLLLLGEISYAVYLVHIIVQSSWRVLQAKLLGSMSLAGEVLCFGVRLLLILGVSYVLYRCVEKPARELVRQRVKGAV